VNAGPSAPPGPTSAFAATQAAWRFLHNERVSLPVLAGPLLEVARRWRQERPATWALVVHDWSALSYPTHTGKADRKSHGSPFSRGYDLGTLLLVDGDTGDPVAPVEMELRTADAVHTTRARPVDGGDSRLDNVLHGMQAIDIVAGRDRVIHILDREADSVGHYRDWQADGRCFLVRGNDTRRVRWGGRELTLAEVQRQLHARGQFRRIGEVTSRGQAAVQHVAETAIVLARPASRVRCRNGTRLCNDRVPGPPLPLRLIVSRVCNARGETLAVWSLYSNAPAEVPAATLARWYYWRWRIESYFKLLKSAGQAAEQWQQETGGAIARRLLVASMACTVVWQLQRLTDRGAVAFRQLLVRLSGRQMKHGTTSTAPALLAGLWVYLAMLDTLDHHSADELRAMNQYLRLHPPDTG
jgi:hypothetical protein